MAARHNENTNPLPRQYLSKGADLRTLNQADLDTIARAKAMAIAPRRRSTLNS
ncbi:hypothetical protein ACIGBL_33990 [Streptomyces sp. NPDC085614]|uniref:hypothetical protein n=1 Tax=Streptomyces sp. NPDC085614 TaxID=3365733 RepID=UPI0037CF8A01